jgi:hypothetical protein
MFSKLVLVALVGVATAQQYAYQKSEESEIWTFTGDAALSAANLDLLEARVAAIEGARSAPTPGPSFFLFSRHGYLRLLFRSTSFACSPEPFTWMHFMGQSRAHTSSHTEPLVCFLTVLTMPEDR